MSEHSLWFEVRVQFWTLLDRMGVLSISKDCGIPPYDDIIFRVWGIEVARLKRHAPEAADAE